MVTPEVRLMILYSVEDEIRKLIPDRYKRKSDVGWNVVQDMIEDEYKHRDALARSPLSGAKDG